MTSPVAKRQKAMVGRDGVVFWRDLPYPPPERFQVPVPFVDPGLDTSSHTPHEYPVRTFHVVRFRSDVDEQAIYLEEGVTAEGEWILLPDGERIRARDVLADPRSRA